MPNATQPAKTFPHLEQAPISEVVCGIVFESVAGLDPLLLGTYWDRRKDDFPNRQLHPALMDENSIIFGAVPVRALLTSADDVFVLQLQHDRFFMNWRARGGSYPRFSERHGTDGLLARTEAEFETYRAFIRDRCGVDVSPSRIELSKIDMLERGRHWESPDDLAKLLPVTGVFNEIQRADEREVNLRFVERGSHGTVMIQITTLSDGKVPRAVRIDARCMAAPEPSLHEAFVRSNAILNDAFFKLIPDAAVRFRDEQPGGTNASA